jgi:hypothetical protein
MKIERFLGLFGLISLIASTGFAGIRTIKCVSGGITATISYVGQQGSYKYESETASTNDRSEDFIRRTRHLSGFTAEDSELGLVISGTYKESPFGENSYEYKVAGTIYKDPAVNSKIIVTRSYYDEAKGQVNGELYQSLTSLSCSVADQEN